MFCNNSNSAWSRPKNNNFSHNGENNVIACSNNKTVTTTANGTNAEYCCPSNKTPARRTTVITASARDAVTGPRNSHLNKRLLTTRSGQDTPKNATAYAIVITKPATKRLIATAALQNARGNCEAIPEPNKRYGYEPSAGAVAPAMRYNILRWPERVNMRENARMKLYPAHTMMPM